MAYESGDSKEPPFNPSEFNADDFLTRLNNETIDAEVEWAEENAETVYYEKQAMDAMELAGFDIEDVQEWQRLLAPDQPLESTALQLIGMLDRLPSSEAVQLLLGNTIHKCFIVASFAADKAYSDAGGPQIKQEEQLRLYADSALDPDNRTALLAVLDILYPDEVGVDPTQPELILDVANYEEDERVRTEISGRARALRELARQSIHESMDAQGIGHHDHAEEVISSLVVQLTREYVVQTGDYDENTKDINTTAVRLILHGTSKEALSMGWKPEQVDAIIAAVRQTLRQNSAQ